MVNSRVRRLAGGLGRDTKPVQREAAMLTATGLIERRSADEVAVGWDRTVTEPDLVRVRSGYLGAIEPVTVILSP